MAMRDTIKQYKAVEGKVVDLIESVQEQGEGTTIAIRFTDQTELNLYVSAYTEVKAELLPANAELLPARKKPHPVHTDAKSKAATA